MENTQIFWEILIKIKDDGYYNNHRDLKWFTYIYIA